MRKGFDTCLSDCVLFAPGYQPADAANPLSLLCVPLERPRCRRAEHSNKLAPPHSMTSSARSSMLDGTGRPSALAVLRLIISEYFVGCCTGRSAGLAPLRMRSMYDAACAYRSLRSNS